MSETMSIQNPTAVNIIVLITTNRTRNLANQPLIREPTHRITLS